MAQSLSLSNAEILRAIGAVIGANRDPEEFDDQTLIDCRQIIRDGLRLFYNPPPLDGIIHQWRFLEKPFYESANAVYETGTITVASGVVTGSGTVFPEWATNGILRVDGHTLFVTTRTSDTVLSINNTTVAVDAGTSYELHQWRFDLPSDFGEFIGGVVYCHPTYGRKLRNVMDTEVRLRHVANFQTGRPCMYSIMSAGPSDVGQSHFSFWPTLDEEAAVSGTYRSVPLDNLDDVDLLEDGATIQADPVHAGTMLEAIRAETDAYYNDRHQDSVHYQRFMERLRASIAYDKQFAGSVQFPASPKVDPERLSLLNHEPTYNDLL